MRTVPIAPVVAMVILVAFPAEASHCETYETIPAQYDSGATAGGRYYAQLEFCQLSCSYALWVYEESNGLDGWQPKDYFIDATCHDMIQPDRELWTSWL